MLLIVLGIVLVAVLMLVALLGLYGAGQLTRPPRSDLEDTAQRWGLPEPTHVWLTALDGVRLSALWLASPSASGSVIVCHGHGGNKNGHLWVATDLFPRFNVLLLDLRGHGKSDGDRTSVGFLERLDVLGAVRWVAEQLGQQPIGAYGNSMGGAAAILAAAESPRIAAVVADSSFARLRSPVVEAICLRGWPRSLSRVLAWSVCTAAGWRLRAACSTRWVDPIDVVNRLAPRPLLLIHGGSDRLTPADNAHALFARAGPPKQLWIVPEAGHAQAAELDPRGYAEHIGGFFDRWLLTESSLELTRHPATAAGAGHRHQVAERELSEVDRS